MEAIVGLLRNLGCELVRYLEQTQKALSSAFIYSNIDSFDEDFRQLLQIFYFFGFYRPSHSSPKRAIYGWLTFVLVSLSILLALLKETLVSLKEESMQKFITSVRFTGLLISVVTQTATFMVKTSEIVGMIKALHKIRDGEDCTSLTKYQKKCCQVVKFYLIYLVLSMSAVACFHLLGFKIFKLALPALYDVWAEGSLYYPLLIVNILQGYFTAFCLNVSDLLHVLCMVRAGANLEIISDKLRHCTGSEDSVENEKKLIACVKYHRRILNETNNIQRIFSQFFISKVVGTIVMLTCYIFIVMNANVHEEAMSFVLGVFGLGISLFQIASLCLIGQWLTTKSADLLDASYDCKWFDQTKSFKKSLMIFRIVCQKEIKVGVVKFDFSHASFYKMMFNSYYYYNNMSLTVEVAGK